MATIKKVSDCCGYEILNGVCSKCNETCEECCGNCYCLVGHICQDCGVEITEEECKNNSGLCDQCVWLLDK